jgi:hypothetical protein
MVLVAAAARVRARGKGDGAIPHKLFGISERAPVGKKKPQFKFFQRAVAIGLQRRSSRE